MKIFVTSFNVHYGKNTTGLADVFTNNKTLAKSDIIFLQEIESHQAEKICRAESIANHLGYNYVYAEARQIKKGNTHGLAILSRFELTNHMTIKLPRYRIMGRIQQRIAQVADIKIGKKTITLCNIHLDTRLGPVNRLLQLDFALENLKFRSLSWVILGGDFNTIPWLYLKRPWTLFSSLQFENIHRHLLERDFVEYGSYKGHSFKRGLLKMRLDHIYTRGLKITDSGIAQEVVISDHKPIWAEVEI